MNRNDGNNRWAMKYMLNHVLPITLFYVQLLLFVVVLIAILCRAHIVTVVFGVLVVGSIVLREILIRYRENTAVRELDQDEAIKYNLRINDHARAFYVSDCPYVTDEKFEGAARNINIENSEHYICIAFLERDEVDVYAKSGQWFTASRFGQDAIDRWFRSSIYCTIRHNDALQKLESNRLGMVLIWWFKTFEDKRYLKLKQKHDTDAITK